MIDPKLAAARVRILEEQPYLGALLWRMRFRAVPDADWPKDALGDICVNKTGLVSFKASYVTTKTRDQLCAALTHEAMHLLLSHMDRVGGRDPGLWNFAGDLCINPDVRQLWPQIVTLTDVFPDHPSLGFPLGLTADAYYDLLEKKSKKGSSCCGSGSGNRHPGEGGEDPADASGGIDPSELPIIRVAVAAEIRKHQKSRGTVPAGLQRLVEESFRPSPVDWRRALAVAARSALRQAGAWDYSYARPPRRRIPGVVLPCMRAPRLDAKVVIDTSGSMSDALLADCLTDVRGILKACGAEVEVISVDAAIHKKKRVGSVKGVASALGGGGGTDMRVGIAEACKRQHGVRADICIVLTDAETPWPSEPTPIPLVIVCPEGAPETPGWARRVERIEA